MKKISTTSIRNSIISVLWLFLFFCAFHIFSRPITKTAPLTSISAESNCVTAFEHTYYVGQSREFCDGTYNGASLGTWRNIISSLHVPSGKQVDLYIRGDNTGQKISFYSDQIDLNTIPGPAACANIWNDCTVSLTVKPATNQINKNVFLIVVDPTMSNGQKSHDYAGWNDPYESANLLKQWFFDNTQGKINYQINQQIEYDGYIPREDGFVYNRSTYETCINDRETCYKGSNWANYSWIVNTFNICQKLNTGEIDEVWINGGIETGLYESRLAGPNGYWYNSGPLEGTSCNKLIAIMGFNFERDLDMMVHDYFHRAESAMIKVYDSWNMQNPVTDWDKFSLIDLNSSTYAYSGCGYGHFPPNGVEDYDYDNAIPVYSYCDDYYNYPYLGNQQTRLKLVDCNVWGCDGLGYAAYWFSHFPRSEGVGSDGKLNDWWKYIIDPNSVYEIVNQAPTRPSNPTPAANAVNVSKVAKLSWNASTDPDGDPIRYDVFLAKTGNTLVRVATNLTTTSYTPTLDFSTNYSWRVRAKDNKSGVVNSAIWKFTTMSDILQVRSSWYPETDPRLSYSANWTGVSNTNALSGKYKKTETYGAFVQYKINSNAFTLLRSTLPSGGKFAVCIDGSCKAYTNYSQALKWQQKLEFKNLTGSTPHTIKIINKELKVMIIDGILVWNSI